MVHWREGLVSMQQDLAYSFDSWLILQWIVLELVQGIEQELILEGMEVAHKVFWVDSMLPSEFSLLNLEGVNLKTPILHFVPP